VTKSLRRNAEPSTVRLRADAGSRGFGDWIGDRSRGYKLDMIFRTADRNRAEGGDREALLAACERTFGRHPDAVDGDEIELDGLTYVYDPSPATGDQPAFVLRPECDRCGCRDLDQFPLETWTIDGAEVRAQARATCRPCRFTLLIAGQAPPLDLG
jgi:hypothetical protein